MTAAAIMFVVGVGDLFLGARALTSAGSGPVDPTAMPQGRDARSVHDTARDWMLRVIVWVFAAAGFLYATEFRWSSVGIALAVSVVASVLLELRARGLALLGCAVLLIAIAVAVVFDPAQVPETAPLAVLVATGPLAAMEVTPTVLVMTASALVFLGATSNVLVRVVVRAARGSDHREAAPTRDQESWRLLRRGRELAVVRKSAAVRVGSGFRGGRMVGPLERALVLASLLSGLPLVIAGLIAAKGVVRFPEISADRNGGTKAEEFLVGTLCSLLLAGLAALAIVVRSH